MPENLWWYLVKHKGCSVPSPVLLEKWVDSFVSDIRAFAAIDGATRGNVTFDTVAVSGRDRHRRD